MVSEFIKKGLFIFILVFLAYSLAFASEAKEDEKSVTEKILNILIEKKIINEAQYQELMAQLKEEAKKKEKEVRCGFKKGFYIETHDKSNKIKLAGRLHTDFKSYLGDHPGNSSFFIRRARLTLKGTLYKYYDFKVQSDFAKGNSQLKDGFLNINYIKKFQIKIGQFKTPFSMEELVSGNSLDFMERSLANRLVPSRDIGVMFHGSLFDDAIYYQAGIFNGYRTNESSDKDDGKDGALRLVVAPFKFSNINLLKELRIGGAITYGNEELQAEDWWNKGDFKTAAGTKYLEINDSALQDGERFRKGSELYWSYGPVNFKGEYIHVSLDKLKLNGYNKGVYLHGGYLSLCYNITGEKFIYKNGSPRGIIPKNNFKPDFSSIGAIQIGIRYEFVKADKDLFKYGYVDSSRYTDKIQAITFGINWYLNDMVRFMFNYYHAKFDDDIVVDDQKINDEDVLMSRFQIYFN